MLNVSQRKYHLQLVQYLDDYIVGQKDAKKVLSVAYVSNIKHKRFDVKWIYRVYNHYNRVRANVSHLNMEDHLPEWNDESNNGEPAVYEYLE